MRAWIDNLLLVLHSKGMRKELDEQTGTLSARAPRRSDHVAGVATTEGPPLGVGRRLTFCVRPSAALHPQIYTP